MGFLNGDGLAHLKETLATMFAPKAQQVPFVAGTQTAATGAWTGVASTVTALYDGLTIRYWLPYAGSGNATLNLTLADGSTTGAMACYYGGTSRLTTHYPAGSVIVLTYRKNARINAVTTYTGWWAHAQYYSSDNYTFRHYCEVKAASAIVANNIIVSASLPAGYFHLKTGAAFDVGLPILWASGAIAAGGSGTSNFRAYLSILISTTQSMTLTQYAPIYIKGTLNGRMFTPASTAPLTQTVPASADGYQYILLGVPYGASTTNMYLLPEHPIFEYVNGAFRQTIGLAAASSTGAGLMSAADKTKLDGIAAGAKAGATVTAVTLTAAGWSGSVAPYTKSVSVPGMTAAKNIVVGLSGAATAAQREAAADAGLACTAQGTGTVTITADRAKPLAALPIIIMEV